MGGGHGKQQPKAAARQEKTLTINVKELDAEVLGTEEKRANTSPVTSSERTFFGHGAEQTIAQELGFDFDALKEHAKAFFRRINTPLLSGDALSVFKTSILKIRNVDHINLQPHHLSQSVKAIYLQRVLPVDCLIALEDCLREGMVLGNTQVIIKEVSQTHALELPALATSRRQLHHSLPHALEIEKRTMRALKARGIWQDDTETHQFLRDITSCIAVLHDYVQKNNENADSAYESNEEATAAFVCEQLLKGLRIPLGGVTASHEQNNVRKLIQLMTHQMIVGGTTVLMGDFSGEVVPKSMDLIDLQPILEEVKNNIDFERAHDPSNQTLIDEITQVAKELGKHDKMPGAVLINVIDQARDQALATMPLVRKHCHGMQMISAFFESIFTHYFSEMVLRPYYTAEDEALFGSEEAFFVAVNQQAFFTSFIPHLSMPPEFLPEGNHDQVNLYAFIAACRQQYSDASDDFAQFFDDAFEQYGIADIVSRRFFSSGGIAFEGKFIESQIAPLERRAAELKAEGMSDAMVQALVDPRVPRIDKMNLTALKTFYDSCKRVVLKADEDLIKNLMMGVVLQAGQLLAEQLQVEHTAELRQEEWEISGYR
ncbi:MAG: hypothetical protein K0U37_08760 [Gammaproteobacteria bacterium]|nr:hypothetical protein [Gammaproteobacteria bacterium]